MSLIARQSEEAAAREYDLVIVGGGIHGACLALEAARRGLRPILVEKDDFGGGVSWNSLRIIHGGLRYLQSLDLRRHRESVGERAWFLREFPDLVRPLPCLMPLYGDGMRKPAIFRLALFANAMLSPRQDPGPSGNAVLPPGEVFGAEQTATEFAAVDRAGLRGGALWFDGVMQSGERVLMEVLRRACHHGAVALNYCEARELLVEKDAAVGLSVLDSKSNETLELRAPRVVNCAGPRCRALAQAWHCDVPELFEESLGFNLVLDRPPLSQYGLAVAPKKPGARTYFLVPWENRTVAGTYHMPWKNDAGAASPPREAIDDFISDLNAAVPGIGISPAEILRVQAGLLPAVAAGETETRSSERIEDHGATGGPAGLYSVSGVKYTTARLVAERTLDRMACPPPSPPAQHSGEAPALRSGLLEDILERLRSDPAALARELETVVREESVVHLDDLVLRRLGGPHSPAELEEIGELGADAMGLEGSVRAEEMARLTAATSVLRPGAH